MAAHYDDLPDTTVYLRDTGRGHDDAHRPGPSRCGCNPAFGASCPSCTGESTEQWQALKARRDEVRQQWRRREITAREYVALTSAVASDGLPSRDAAEALARANRDETRGSAA